MKKISICVIFCLFFIVSGCYSSIKQHTIIEYKYGILFVSNTEKVKDSQFIDGYISRSKTVKLIAETDRIVFKPGFTFGVIVNTNEKIEVKAKWIYPTQDNGENEIEMKEYVYKTEYPDKQTFYGWTIGKEDLTGHYKLETTINNTQKRTFDFNVIKPWLPDNE